MKAFEHVVRTTASPRASVDICNFKAVAYLRTNLEERLNCFRYATLAQRIRVRTTNAIERRFGEVLSRTWMVGVVPGRHLSM